MRRYRKLPSNHELCSNSRIKMWYVLPNKLVKTRLNLLHGYVQKCVLQTAIQYMIRRCLTFVIVMQNKVSSFRKKYQNLICQYSTSNDRMVTEIGRKKQLTRKVHD